jgi:hypothetical protein
MVDILYFRYNLSTECNLNLKKICLSPQGLSNCSLWHFQILKKKHALQGAAYVRIHLEN